MQICTDFQDVNTMIDKRTPIIYGYCRISRPQQSIERQIRNIKSEYPNAVIVQEAYTGTKMDRPEWGKLQKKIKSGDSIVFDSVSRMSRNADEGIETYFEMYENGVQLIFLKEHYIDTAVYAENMRDKIELQGTDEDEIFKGLNNYFRKLAAKQIRIAFEQSEKEVQDLQQRTKEGIETARLNGKQIGQKPGNKLNVKKAGPAKEKIKKYSKDFYGSLADPECIQLVRVSRNTFYKYKRELRQQETYSNVAKTGTSKMSYHDEMVEIANAMQKEIDEMQRANHNKNQNPERSKPGKQQEE